jgi:L-ascorbate metabolism protein UlaG (beta-lactamase superfamily)
MTVSITWYGHACFRLEADGVSVVTDPYTPETSGFRPVSQPADVVVRSSPVDGFHCNAAMIPGSPELVEAVDLVGKGPHAYHGVEFETYPTQESLVHKSAPLDNAMYRFTLGGVRVLHLGDLGNAFEPSHLDALRDQVDVMLTLVGGPPTIELEDLDRALAEIRPRVVIPMHFKVPQLKLRALPVDVFLGRHEGETVRRVGSPTVEVDPSALPGTPEIWVLEPAC